MQDCNNPSLTVALDHKPALNSYGLSSKLLTLTHSQLPTQLGEA